MEVAEWFSDGTFTIETFESGAAAEVEAQVWVERS